MKREEAEAIYDLGKEAVVEIYCPHLSRPNPNYHLLKCFFFMGTL
jgi:hypothetical protein